MLVSRWLGDRRDEHSGRQIRGREITYVNDFIELIMADKLTGMVPDTRMITMTNEGNFVMPRSYGTYQPVKKCQTVINVYVLPS